MYEWRHLHLCLVDELERYASSHTSLQPTVMPTARRALAELCSEGVCQSASQYARLQQTEAAGRVRDMEQAIQQLQDVDRSRQAVWREAAHDLRGNVGIVKNAATVLRSKDLPEDIRDRSMLMLRAYASGLVNGSKSQSLAPALAQL